ncbi:type III polyketide synthase [Rhodococcus triatomae]|uniref:Predicted naringenin-chalcone synthase n=1 Tax=Rhodococcus triatomae TaxID=300028 RepID=A0A1G8M847_9NOCA|nr:type III polyketide synthase [Rhodococcus triatomae]QNG18166.1 type III polyketide synthase [Rhodococcus triatomae]QNG22164.1 type III polyketide synthase [Rhodococcus triatomae]SDI64136.1 Predicted naringenin-chalcone synthase [Rhodococcus triatomae]
MTTAYINRISTAVPEHDVHQAFVDFADNTFTERRKQLLFRRMADRAQISHRWAGIGSPDSFYGDDPNSVTTETRMIEFERNAPGLATRAVDGLNLGDQAAEVTHLIVISCTGFFSPGIDFEIIEKCGVPMSVERTTIGFMGCFAGINGLKTAHHIVRSEPNAKVLVVSLELCSLHLQRSDSLETMLSFLVFGDGCAAVLVSAEEEGIAIDSFKALMVPESAELITWRIGDIGFDMVLSGKVPGVLSRTLDEPNVKSILSGAEKDSINLWAVHPGGRSILDAVEEAVGLEPEALSPSRHVLDNYGNMSSATVLFVLAEMMERAKNGGPTGSGCAMAFGPGLTAETMLFHI